MRSPRVAARCAGATRVSIVLRLTVGDVQTAAAWRSAWHPHRWGEKRSYTRIGFPLTYTWPRDLVTQTEVAVDRLPGTRRLGTMIQRNGGPLASEAGAAVAMLKTA